MVLARDFSEMKIVIADLITFNLQEDALSCILGLDGFYVDGRNIRASYGTSKYCSAFIKNVRCNNPDCTYLHCMGDSEDTFTKQEIQAGYVTSGRDVLARQQQLAAASGGSGSRRRVGNGGPSGTGKAASSPVFPPPTYEEPSKPSQSAMVPPPPSTSSTTQFPPVGAALQRATTSAGFSAAAHNGSMPSLAEVTKMSRASSVPSAHAVASAQKPEPALTPAEMLSRQQAELRKRHPQNSTNANKPASTAIPTPQPVASEPIAIERLASVPPINAAPSTTAASIVAGVHSTSRAGPSQPAPHTTLTALTPLKRAPSLSEKRENTGSSKSVNMGTEGLSSAEQAAFITSRQPRDTSMKLSALRSNSTTLANDSISNGAAIAPMKAPARSVAPIIGSIGGKVIGSSGIPPIAGPLGSFGNLDSIGNINRMNSNPFLGSIGPSSLGAEGSQPIGGFGSNSNIVGGNSILSSGANNGQWSSLGESKGTASDSIFGASDFGSIGGAGFWESGSSQNNAQRYAGPNGAIGGNRIGETPTNNASGSSALASMLGIQLPTGVGSLRETLWASSTPLRAPGSEQKINAPTPIGAGIKKSNVGLIIGGHPLMGSGGGYPIGGYGSAPGPANGGNKNDVALLQSLLPGVHITSGNAYQPAAPNAGGGHNPFGGSGWGGFSNAQQNQQPPIGVGGLMPNQQQHQQQQSEPWSNGSGFYNSAPGPQQQNDPRKQQGHPNIW